MALTTHYMEEAERLCDRLVVMDHGKILCEGKPEALVREYAGREVVEVRGSPEALRQLKAEVEQAEATEHNGVHAELVADTLYLRLKNHALEFLERFPHIRDKEFFLRPANLEDVFLRLTGRDLRD